MPKIVPITHLFAVSDALAPADFAFLAQAGFKSILSHLPDGENARHPTSVEEARLAALAGLLFRHVPATKHDVLSARVLDGTEAAARELEGPILAHCASGFRSALAWGAAAARWQPVEDVLAVLAKAGFNFEPLREELAGLRMLQEGVAPPAALDAKRAW